MAILDQVRRFHTPGDGLPAVKKQNFHCSLLCLFLPLCFSDTSAVKSISLRWFLSGLR
jgi:hypothetical protein